MNIKSLSACMLVSALLFPVVGYSAETDSDGAMMTYVKDSAITAKVKAKLASDSTTSAMKITVETDNSGTVWLAGTAKSKEESDKASAITKATDGVKSVKNQIKIVPAE
ncbi:MAG: transporter [Betaproteobacteria bacterium HGW-Betaproteobacteria-1]|jgi:hyperosmotically inducible protein|nr:MAG: transporter [Betaproteobacteria bacterium HGW-Betaproteobacteria-1]